MRINYPGHGLDGLQVEVVGRFKLPKNGVELDLIRAELLEGSVDGRYRGRSDAGPGMIVELSVEKFIEA